MSNNKRPALSPPPGKPAPRSPPFAGAEPTLASVSEARVDPAVEELSAALRQAAEAFNKITALLSEQQELLKSASRSSSPGGVFNSFINYLKAIVELPSPCASQRVTSGVVYYSSGRSDIP